MIIRQRFHVTIEKIIINMKKSTYIIVLGMFFMISCSEVDPTLPTDKDNAPGPVSNLRAEPFPGGASIYYELPGDESLRYVRAEYSIRDGVSREAKSSLYNNFITVEGFPDTSSYEVKLYAVSAGEKSSEPVSIEIKPLLPPLIEAYKTLEFKEAFGGFTISFSNEGRASLAVTLLAQNELGEMSAVETYYTESEVGEYSLRGFAAEPQLFGAVIRDRWGNLSDTIKAQLTPIFEELIPKDNFQAYNLPTDTYEKHIPNGDMAMMWDDRIAPNGGIGLFHTKPGSGMPQWFTFDMGELVLLSRYTMHHRGPGAKWAYQLAAPKKWEVYGSADVPDPSGDWEGWIKLGEFNSYKPSGDGPVTNEDAAYATSEGEGFVFEEGSPPVRYLRFKILETWGFVDYIYIQELTFYGSMQ